ncbi:MAG TPA: ImmA/IrrE family metallo-endopeptidase [Verrucomicrobiae bacterium]|nr:ImmA/IrrE family metallo-endopeptidase [Verrucomicrobiae bacterium]
MKLDVPYLTYQDIGRKTQEFLSLYHPSLSIPVPIEQIIEFDLEMNIIPLPNLYRQFSINGFLTSDFEEIYVDEIQFSKYNEKYRFTLAHELGHFVLHKDSFKDVSVTSLQEYVGWHKMADNDDIGWFETHGNWFAEQLLVPSQQLVAVYESVIKKHKKLFAKLPKVPPDVWSYLSNEICLNFQVSPAVIECRMRREGITSEASFITLSQGL